MQRFKEEIGYTTTHNPHCSDFTIPEQRGQPKKQRNIQKGRYDFRSICETFNDRDDSTDSMDSNDDVKEGGKFNIFAFPKFYQKGYKLSPSVEERAKMHPKILKEYSGVTISNRHGSIKFKDPIDMTKTDFSKKVIIDKLNVIAFKPLNMLKAKVILYDISNSLLKSDDEKKQNIDLVIKTIGSMYSINKQKFNKVTNSYTFVTDHLQTW